MMTHAHGLLLALHALAAAWWVGGMAVLTLAVRPALPQALSAPPQRVALMAAVLARFLRGVDVAIATLFGTGLAMVFTGGGFAAQRPSVHAMLGLALVMTALYGVLRGRLFPRLRAAAAAGDAPAGAAALKAMHRIVVTNLVLGCAVVVIAVAR